MANEETAPASADAKSTDGRAVAAMDLVLRESELRARGDRNPDYEGESRALGLLLEEMANPDGDILQCLVDTAMSLCAAHSAGISVLQASDGGALFRWRAVAGQWAPFAGGTMPREKSPCGIVLDHDRPLLFRHPERHYALDGMLPAISEVLLIPFHLGGQPVGTVWVVSHDENRRFDKEDERLMTSLARFASTACQLLETQAEARASALDNARLYEQAMVANQAKDDFFSALSHELRTPLTSILGWSEFLELDLGADSTLQAARAIKNAATLQARLINDLLDTSRLMTGKFAIVRSDIDLRDLLDEVTTSFRPAAERKSIDLRQEGLDSLTVPADPVRLRQVVSNLLSNALKFTPPGGAVTVSLERLDSEAAIIAKDSGEGIPAAFVPHVFERYAQLGERRDGGMGLGLTIVRHIVELHGGSVRVESAGEGKGSTFVVRLPLAGSSS
jgi:signal transduction histidine kinase